MSVIVETDSSQTSDISRIPSTHLSLERFCPLCPGLALSWASPWRWSDSEVVVFRNRKWAIFRTSHLDSGVQVRVCAKQHWRKGRSPTLKVNNFYWLKSGISGDRSLCVRTPHKQSALTFLKVWLQGSTRPSCHCGQVKLGSMVTQWAAQASALTVLPASYTKYILQIDQKLIFKHTEHTFVWFQT